MIRHTWLIHMSKNCRPTNLQNWEGRHHAETTFHYEFTSCFLSDYSIMKMEAIWSHKIKCQWTSVGLHDITTQKNVLFSHCCENPNCNIFYYVSLIKFCVHSFFPSSKLYAQTIRTFQSSLSYHDEYHKFPYCMICIKAANKKFAILHKTVLFCIFSFILINFIRI